MSYQSMEEAKLRGEKENIPFWKAIQLEDAQERDVKIEDSWEKMKYMWQSMLDALDAYEPDKVSRSGLVGTEGGLMDSYRETKEPLCGDFVAKVMSNALKMGCNNACMKRIVAAPTAGACGVLPAVLVTYYKEYNVPEEKMIEAMYVAAGLGQIIANRAYLAGASGGCQAEIGSGSGMAAGAICYIKGGDTDQIGHACAMALKNLMGLVCDPVGGLLFIVLYTVLPKSMYAYIGIIGGIGVGYSAGYSWQTVFNTFGALSIASGLFGMPYAVALRIGANLFGSVYTVLCNKLFDKAHAYFHSTDLKTTLS